MHKDTCLSACDPHSAQATVSGLSRTVLRVESQGEARDYLNAHRDCAIPHFDDFGMRKLSLIATENRSGGKSNLLPRLHQSMSRVGYLGIVLAIVAALPPLYCEFQLHLHDWQPLRLPLSLLEPAFVNSPPFKTDLTGTYILSLILTPLPDVRREDCLIGDDFPKGSCISVRRSLDLSWIVLENNGRVISRETYKPHAFSGSTGELGIELGTFEAQAGKQYKVALEVLGPSPELNTAHPALKVEAHRVYWEKWVILAQMSVLFASALGTVAAACIGWHFLRGRQRGSCQLSSD